MSNKQKVTRNEQKVTSKEQRAKRSSSFQIMVTAKTEILREIIKQNVDVLAVAKTKIDASFPSAQFFLEGCHSPYRFDISCKSGVL